jgi:hypothetical protein
MPPSEQPNWQPISQLPLIASLIDGGAAEAMAQRQILTEARARPHLLDDATCSDPQSSAAGIAIIGGSGPKSLQRS